IQPEGTGSAPEWTRLAPEEARLMPGWAHPIPSEVPGCILMRSPTESTMPGRIITQRTQEIDRTQIRSERLDKVKLTVRSLPEHEVTEPLFPGRANHQIRVGLTSGIQVLADQFRGEPLGKFLQPAPFRVVRGDDRAHRVDDLSSPAIPDGEIDVQARVRVGAPGGLGEQNEKPPGKSRARSHVLHPPFAKVRQLLGEVSNDVDKLSQFRTCPIGEVVTGEQVEGNRANPQIIAPFEKLLHLDGTGTVPVHGGGVSELLCPAAIPVNDHRHVLRQVRSIQFSSKSAFIEAIQDATTEVRKASCHSLTLAVHRPEPRPCKAVRLPARTPSGTGRHPRPREAVRLRGHDRRTGTRAVAIL